MHVGATMTVQQRAAVRTPVAFSTGSRLQNGLKRTCTPFRSASLAIAKPAPSRCFLQTCAAAQQSSQRQEVPHAELEFSESIDRSGSTSSQLVDVEVVDPTIEASSPPVPHWQQLAQSLAKGAAVFALAAALALAPLSGSAWAASSGGRMGGSSFSSARSSGGFSSGMSRGYSGGGGGSLGGGYSRGYSYGGGMSRAPSVTVMPQTSFGFGYWGGPGYYGGGYGAPVVSTGGGGGGLFTLLAVGVLAYAALQILPNLGGGSDDSGYGKMTVAKVQVGLVGSARSLKRDLERIAKRTDTNTPEGLSHVLQETVLALLRNPEYCTYASANTKSVKGLDAAEERFNQASMTERGKFQEETLVNVGGRSKNTSGQGKWDRRSSSDPGDELIVVTILVAAESDVKIPNISNPEQLRQALNRLGGLRTDQVLAVEVLWTPQDDGDTFTRDEIAIDYPKLNLL